MDFAGLTAIVTGGASGIGLATAALLAERGARVACLDLQPEVPPPLLGIKTDIRDDTSVLAAISAVTEAFGGIDIVINNAGVGAIGTVEDNADDEWHHIFDVNVFGLVRVTRAALPLLRLSKAPVVVNVCSIAATAGLPNRALYSATKGAVLALTRAMAADHVGEGIRVNAVNPGTVATPWVDRLLAAVKDPEAERAALAARQPTGRLVTAEEVAAAIVYLASPQAKAVTGTALAVDGGMDGLRTRPARNPEDKGV